MSMLQIEFYGDPCRSCEFEWSATDESLLAELRTLADTYRSVLNGLPGSARHPDLDWCASAYVLHVSDNLREHAQRMAAALAGWRGEFVVTDQDEVARAREYAEVPLEAALWSLATVVGPYEEVFVRASVQHVPLPHPSRGLQYASEVLHGNVHDAHHHGWDLARIALANGAH